MTALSEFNSVYYPILLVALIIVVVMFRNILLPKGERLKQIFIWGNLSCVILFILWFGIGAVTNQYQYPWYAYHTITGHHIYDIIGFCGLFLFTWVHKNYRPVWAMIITVFLIGTNEWAWWITYYLSRYTLHQTAVTAVGWSTSFGAIENLTIFNFTGIAYIIVIAVFFYRIRFANIKLFDILPTKSLYLIGYFAVLYVIYNYWLSIGFPITVDFSGNTIYYLSYMVNMIENIHWLIPTLYIIIFFDYIFAQNSNLKGMPPSFFRNFFKGKENEIQET